MEQLEIIERLADTYIRRERMLALEERISKYVERPNMRLKAKLFHVANRALFLEITRLEKLLEATL